MKTFYASIVEDRHSDTEVFLFQTPDEALTHAKGVMVANSTSAVFVDLSDQMTEEQLAEAGWLFHGVYSNEGDSVRVLPINLQSSGGDGDSVSSRNQVDGGNLAKEQAAIEALCRLSCRIGAELYPYQVEGKTSEEVEEIVAKSVGFLEKREKICQVVNCCDWLQENGHGEAATQLSKRHFLDRKPFIQVGSRVSYIPPVNPSGRYQEEQGTVSYRNHDYAYVKFDVEVEKLGKDAVHAQGCRIEDLRELD